jgi:hypothetical protein
MVIDDGARRRPASRRSLLLGLMLGACTGGEAAAPPSPAPLPPLSPATATPEPSRAPPPAVAPPTPSASMASPSPNKGPDTHGWEGHWPTSWTDPRVVAALSDACDFAPVPPEDPGAGTPGNIFACGLEFEQACVTDDCSDQLVACKHACESVCGGCNAACTTTCGSCEASCKDAACRGACAATTATCKQACVRTMDRCSTGGCVKAEATCASSHAKAFSANRCPSRCEAYSKCRRACPSGAGEESCDTACGDALAPGFERCRARCQASPASSVERARCERACGEASPCNPRSCTE